MTDRTRWDPTMGPVTTLGSYQAIPPAFYLTGQPDTPFQAGAKGWSSAPVINWGQNPAQAGPSRLAVNGLGAAPTECVCQDTDQGQKCLCKPVPPPPAPEPFWHRAPSWYWPRFVETESSPWGSGKRAYSVPRRRVCPTCHGTRVPTSPQKAMHGLGSDQWGVIPWWCWKNPDGSSNRAFINCKDQAIAQGRQKLCGGLSSGIKEACEKGITSAQRIQWQMDACSQHCRKPSTSHPAPTPAPPSPTTPDSSLPQKTWRDYLPQMNTTTLVVAALVATAGAVYAQKKGWI